MKVRIRRPAIFFALFSAVYWFLVSDLIGVASPLDSFDKQPFWKVTLASMLPATIYAVATLYFGHWLARRILRQVTRKEGE